MNGRCTSANAFCEARSGARSHRSLRSSSFGALSIRWFSGSVIVYRSKRADGVKILIWDTSGLVLIWKQLQHGSFRSPPIMDGVVKLSAVEFTALFSECIDRARPVDA